METWARAGALCAALLAIGCAAPELAPPGPPLRTPGQVARMSPNVIRGPLRPFPQGELTAPLVRAPGEPAPHLRAAEAPALWPTVVEGASFDEDAGGRLLTRLGELDPAGVAANGVAMLTLDELFGTPDNDFEDALCEPLGFTWPVEEGGRTYDAAGFIFPFTTFEGEMRPYDYSIYPPCESALETKTVDATLAAGTCHEDDELSLFPAGSDCRACLDEGSGWSSCEDADRCSPSGQYVWWWYGTDESGAPDPDNRVLVETHAALTAACAPDQFVTTLAVARADGDPAPPAPWATGDWIGQCIAYWEPALNDIFVGCQGETLLPGRDDVTYGTTFPFRMVGLTKRGEDFPAYWDRLAWANAIRFDFGPELTGFWSSPGVGLVAAPAADGGWGVPPAQLRPDGESFARDYVAAMTLKASTLLDGVLVTGANRDRCEEDAWLGPDARGRYRCTALREVEDDGWIYDGDTSWGDAAHTAIFPYPMVTLASTGLPDPDVPGGVVVHVASSPGYAALEGWSYPHTFEPDLTVAPSPDGAPGVSPLTFQTYRFGKDPQWDIRFVMSTNWQRFHHPYGPEAQ